MQKIGKNGCFEAQATQKKLGNTQTKVPGGIFSV